MEPSPIDGLDELLAPHVLLVTGKGGVGKTTVAAALGVAAADAGRRTLLVDLEQRQSLSRAFDTAPWDYEERQFRPGLWGVAIDPADAVYEYLELFYGLKRVQWVMERSSALDFVTTAAPGLRDLLLIGKVYEIEQRRRADGRRAYDSIVVDAPPTGRIVPFLQSPESVTEIARVGPIKRQAGQIRDMLASPNRLQAVLVTLLEEMPVRETVESIAALAEAEVTLGPVIANQVLTPHLDDEAADALETLGADGLAGRAADAGAELSGPTAQQAMRLARAHHERAGMQRELWDELALEDGPTRLRLPMLTGASFDADDLDVLADALALQVGDDGPRAAHLRAALEVDG